MIERSESLNTLRGYYSVIFVPYALSFWGYLLVSALIAGGSYFFGAPPSFIGFVILPIVLGCGIAILTCFFSCREFAIWNRNRKARNNSSDPLIRLLEEKNGLHFKPNNIVEYCKEIKIKPLSESATKMTFFLEWHGGLEDVRVVSKTGCDIHVQKKKEDSGIDVVASFTRNLSPRSEYPFSFILEFKNHSNLIRPFLRKIQPYVAERLLIQFLKFEQNRLTRFIESEYGGPYAGSPLNEKVTEVSGGYHEHKILRPRQGRSYKIAVEE